MDSAQRLLGRGFLRFDMRDPTRFVARLDRQVRSIDGSVFRPQAEPAPSAPPPAEPASGGLEKVNDSI
jgi:cell division protein FtsQ